MPGATAAAKRAPLTAAPDTDDAQVEDLDAATVTLEWNGQVVGTIPKRRGRWPSRAGRLFEQEKFASALVALLGEEAYARLEDEICPFIDDLNAFSDYAGEVIAAECVS